MPAPMKLMMAVEFGSTGAAEMSAFHRLSAGNGTKPFRLALCPRLIALQLGGGLPVLLLDVTCRFCALEVALPGLGLVTVTANVPADAALPLAESCVEDIKVVVNGVPAKTTCAPLTKPLPFAVIVNVPEETEGGETLLSTGVGFNTVTALLPDAVASAALTACTVTAPELGMLDGAV